MWRGPLRGQTAVSTSGGAIEAVVQTKEAEEAGHLAVHIELQPLVHQHTGQSRTEQMVTYVASSLSSMKGDCVWAERAADTIQVSTRAVCLRISALRL